MNSIVTYSKYLASKYSADLNTICKIYKKGLNKTRANLRELAKKIMEFIRNDINKILIIVSLDSQQAIEHYQNILWRNIGLYFTDAKVRKWLKHHTITFGTTDLYSAILLISQMKTALLYIDYIRYVRQKPLTPLIFESKILYYSWYLQQ